MIKKDNKSQGVGLIGRRYLSDKEKKRINYIKLSRSDEGGKNYETKLSQTKRSSRILGDIRINVSKRSNEWGKDSICHNWQTNDSLRS